jgi:hypothetical protein
LPVIHPDEFGITDPIERQRIFDLAKSLGVECSRVEDLV